MEATPYTARRLRPSPACGGGREGEATSTEQAAPPPLPPPQAGEGEEAACYLARSPSMLAATDSFDRVKPDAAISCTALRTRSTCSRCATTHASTAPEPAGPLA